ncbi:hypothetical protein B0H17DRAFT_1139844 [Mycena rosella]|uniref:Uncharacterized protein n=1 Tax=Mycena rosella TaxID=1033263 RepID=A0AAD7D3Q7_MYCRO|nr:hypothetical protein B0H17DRAFT_1139844 [Mycena rosella]
MNPLHIPELVDRCIDLLGNSEPDLHACSLVGHSWVHPAQSRIFRVIDCHSIRMTDQPEAPRLLDILKASPHLTRYVSTVSLYKEALSSPDLFLRFCNQPYTRLSHVSILAFDDHSFDTSAGIQKLLSLPTVLSVDLGWSFTHKEQFLLIWKHCTSHIKHLALRCRIKTDRAAPAVDPGFTARRQIKLESFKMDRIGDFQWWWDNPRCPLDFSELKALHSSDGMNAFQRGILVPALASVEVVSEMQDLSGFQRLAELHLTIINTQEYMHGPQSTIDTIATICPQYRDRLRAILFRLFILPPYDDAERALSGVCAEIDSRLSEVVDTLPNLAIVHMYTNIKTTASREQYFPLLDPQMSIQWISVRMREGSSDTCEGFAWSARIAGVLSGLCCAHFILFASPLPLVFYLLRLASASSKAEFLAFSTAPHATSASTLLFLSDRYAALRLVQS